MWSNFPYTLIHFFHPLRSAGSETNLKTKKQKNVHPPTSISQEIFYGKCHFSSSSGLRPFTPARTMEASFELKLPNIGGWGGGEDIWRMFLGPCRKKKKEKGKTFPARYKVYQTEDIIFHTEIIQLYFTKKNAPPKKQKLYHESKLFWGETSVAEIVGEFLPKKDHTVKILICCRHRRHRFLSFPPPPSHVPKHRQITQK